MASEKVADIGVETDDPRDSDHTAASIDDSDDAEFSPSSLDRTSQQLPDITTNTLPDLSSLQGIDLRKTDLAELRATEANGSLYMEHFRVLQLHPMAYNNFFHEIVQHVRNKYTDHLKRGTISSFRSLSVVLLRGFGYIVWSQDSRWLIADSDLNANEKRLVYDRKKNIHENSRFFAILENFWKMLRNATFEPKSAEKRTQSGRLYVLTQPHTKPVSGLLPQTSQTIRSESASYGSGRERHPSGSQSSGQLVSGSRCDISVPREIMNYMTMIMIPFAYMSGQSTSEQPVWPKEKAMQLWDEIIKAHDLAAEITTPDLYKVLCEKFTGCEHPMHILMGIDSDLNPDDAWRAESASHKEQIDAIVANNKILLQNSLMDMIANLNMSNGPWIRQTDLVGRPKVSESSKSPPDRLNVWISASKALEYGSATSVAKSTRAWALPSAPVGSCDMDEFLKVLDQRAEVPSSCVTFCYVLSYGWNDSMIVIDNDNPALEMSDGSPCREKRKAGWQVFQKDLQAAAEEGIHDFRLKALVLYGEAGHGG